ncbi:MAG: Asp/Glu racemase [Burkholderiales bacterium]|nr:MAG: Asp/Glu racemase [Betaproteobacteria bacterium]TAG78624.1 MAG: Asp/Glu racemase [Burkholderiales bacterium]
MPRLLIVNPNTSDSVTTALAARARALAPEGSTEDDTVAVTASFGAPYIVDETSVAVASHALLAALAEHTEKARPSAVLVGCFGDPGLLAARERCNVPVLGLADAAMREASALGTFSIVTGGIAWPPMLRRLAASLGWQDALVDVVAVEKNGGELAADPMAARELLKRACEQALQSGKARSIIVGGAALAGFAEALRAEMPVPLIDSVDSGIRAAWRAASAQKPGRFDVPEWFTPR